MRLLGSRLLGAARFHRPRQNASGPPCLPSRCAMRSAARTDKDSPLGGWADDWTAALERPSVGARSSAEPRASPSPSTTTCTSPPAPLLAAVCPAAPKPPCGALPNPLPGAASDSSPDEREPFPEPFPMHYCSAAERDEWAAVLCSRDRAEPRPDPLPPPPSHTGASSTPADHRGSDTGLNHPSEPPQRGAAAEVPGAAAAAAREPAAAAAVVATAVAPGGAEVSPASATLPLKPALATVGGGGSRTGGSGGGSGAAIVLAAIELGSHCTRAVLHDGRHELAQLTYNTMLGQPSAQHDGCSKNSSSGGGGGSGGGGDLNPEALQRTLKALQSIMEAASTAAAAAAAAAAAGTADEAAACANAAALDPRCSSGRRPRIAARMVATAAVRNASVSSRTALAEAAERLVGCSLEVLTGEEEGRLAWRGVVGGLQCLAPSGYAAVAAATPQLPAEKDPEQQQRQRQHQQQQRLLVVDMGGRSTEFVYGHKREDRPLAASLPLGCVSLHATACGLAADGGRDGGNGGDGAVSELNGRGGGNGTVSEPESPSLEALGACVLIARETVERLRADMPWLPTLHTGAVAADACGLHDPTPNVAGSAAVAAPAAASPPSDASPAKQSSEYTEDSTTVNAACGGGGGDGAVVVVFTGGTVTTLAALHQRLPYYDRARVHGSLLTSYDIWAMMAHLAAPEGRAAALASYDWLTEARCRTLAAGCAGLLGVMAALGVDQVTVSDADLLDGLLADTLGRLCSLTFAE
ncbi:hypothetical protein PLESTF_000532200 [Pleodorina starrii]|nr:hypothetical protein PLESTF_000532200 [Pleodorina starrii]